MKVVYTITEREVRGEKKSFWTKIGAAFDNRDGSLTIRLEALPLNGVLQVREEEPKQKDGGGGGNKSPEGDIPF